MNERVKSILHSNQDGPAKIAELMSSPSDLDDLSSVDLATMDAALKGFKGCEYFQFPKGFSALVEFYEVLSARNPQSAEILRLLADAYHLSNNAAKAIAVFLDAINKSPELIYEVRGDFCAIVPAAGPEEKVKYWLACIRALLRDGDVSTAKTLYGDLLSEFRGRDILADALQIAKMRDEIQPLLDP